MSNLVGKIQSVYCKNFVTYKECKFYPTEYLNIVIGPNGTGKSTLVAAIIIGLGGDVKVLSRALDIRSYIKNKETDALINVSIYTSNSGTTTTFQRAFNQDNISVFKIDNKVFTRQKFLAVVASYKIQITNLCSFLPQDRVQDFAKMNPQELFHNTIISVCSEDVINQFKQLKELQKERSVHKINCEGNRKKLGECEARLEELKQALHVHQARQEYEQKLGVCQAKLAWLAIDDIKAKLQEYATDLNAATNTMGEHIKMHKLILKKQQELDRKANCLKNKINTEEKCFDQLMETNTNINVEIEQIHKHLRNLKLQLEREKRDFKDRETELNHEVYILQITLVDLKTTGTQMKANREAKLIENCDLAIRQLRSEEAEYIKARGTINSQLDGIIPEIEMLKTRIERLRNNKEQSLQFLKAKFHDVYAMIQWLREEGNNSDMFTGKIHEPMIITLTLPDPKNAQYLENTIPVRDLLAFSCEEKSDCSTLLNVAISKKLKINILHTPNARECKFIPEPIDNYKKYGFSEYLLNMVRGPPALLNFLCSLYRIHVIPIGTENVSKHTDYIKHKIYYGGDVKYVLSISKYSKMSSLMQSTIFPKKLFTTVSEENVHGLNRRLQGLLRESDVRKNERTAIEAKMNMVIHSIQEEVKKKNAAQETINKFHQLEEKRQRQHEIVERLRQRKTLEELENNNIVAVSQNLKQIMNLMEKKLKTMSALKNALINKSYADNELIIFNQQNESIRFEIEQVLRNKENSEKLILTISNTLDNAKRKYKQLGKEAMDLTNNVKPTSDNYPHKSFYLALPNSKEDIMNQLNEFNARLDCMENVDAKITADYRNKTKELESLKAAVTEEIEEDTNKKSEIERIYNSWYSPIEKIVNSLNKHFSDFMQSMDFVGEVLLSKKDEYDFDTYGIDIMVQYRENVPLKALDRNVQSGGERAVAIAMYTLSLQHLTHVPFRCVDEINQGMDPRNERIVFNMLVNEATKDGSCQYFFVTPKLLHSLEYNKRMSVHIVFNGSLVHPSAFTSSLT